MYYMCETCVLHVFQTCHTAQWPAYMASYATPAIYVSFRCITYVEVHVYYMCNRYLYNTHVALQFSLIVIVWILYWITSCWPLIDWPFVGPLLSHSLVACLHGQLCYSCNICVLGVLHIQKYMCITCVTDTCVILMFYTCITCVCYTPVFNIISIHVIQVQDELQVRNELHV